MSTLPNGLDTWLSSLDELSASDPLLDAAVAHAGVAFPGVDAVAMAAVLAAGGSSRVEPGAASDLETGRLRAPVAATDLTERLVAIARRARTARLASGEGIVWLALGELAWCDLTTVVHAAPLVLWPVEVVVRGGEVELVPARDREPRANRTLARRLARDGGLVLPDTTDVAALVEAAAAIALTRPGWAATRAVALGTFSVIREELARDARTIELAAHPLLERLAAAGAVPAMTLPPLDLKELAAPLDADASQLAAIAAVGAGASFVLHAPPGTGATQTIANAIVHAATQGKSVLYASAKPAAREAVQARLAAVGLGELCLALDAPRAQVVAQLGRVLDRAFRPGSGPHGVDARVGELRATLDRHPQAMHRVGPFGRSLHEVIGRLVELRTAPNAALAEADAIGFDRGTFERRKLAVETLARAAVAVEPVAAHPWRASALERWPLAADDHADRLRRTLGALAEAKLAGEELADAAHEVVGLVPGIVATTAAQLAALGTLAAVAAASPRPGAELLAQARYGRGEELGERIALIRARGTGTVEIPRDPATFLALAGRHRQLAIEVDDHFTDAVAELDVGALWTQLRKWTTSVAPLRYVALRAVRAEIRAAAQAGELNSDQAMIDALEAAIAERACRAALVGAAEPAKRWFGELGGDPLALDLAKIEAAVGWVGELRVAFDATQVGGGEAGRTTAWRALVAQVAGGTNAGDDLGVFARAADAVARWQAAIAALTEATGIAADALGATSAGERDQPSAPASGGDHLANLAEQATRLEQAIDSLRDWVGYHAARTSALAAGVGPAVAAIAHGDLGADELALAWERATLLAWGDAELAELPDLGSFHGATHHANVAAFADYDRAALALARTRAIARLAERAPARRGADPSGEIAVLVGALAVTKPARLSLKSVIFGVSPGDEPSRGTSAGPPATVRELLVQIPALLTQLAPCVVASPTAIARDLDRALPRFDVVILDEASQLPMAYAIGAIARGGQLVVVGDAAQLAPPDHAPSLLATAVIARLPALELGTHYRSRHEDVFALANRQAYGDRLVQFPVAAASADLGVVLRRVDSTYEVLRDENRAEAEAVVAELVGRLRDPGQRTRSLAVVTFSSAQRDAIADLLDAARASDPTLDAAYEAALAGPEPLVVETVDALQGHTRDVAIVALGYGLDVDGQLATFGALAGVDGTRLATVAMTRAREQLVVVASIAADDVPADAPPGMRRIAELLEFARTGGAGRGSDEPASPITAAIARALAERGWTVRHQVGCGAYRIDLAVVDPSDPDRAVLAIEHDGRAYATAPSARDRDRTRADALAALGWRLHRIWTLDWWSDSEREVARAHGAIVAAIAATRARRAPLAVQPLARSRSGRVATAPAVVVIPPKIVASASDVTTRNVVGGIEVAVPEAAHSGGVTLASGSGPQALVDAASAPVRVKRGTIAIGPYSAAMIPAGRRAPDDMFAPRHRAELGKVVEQVLAAEAPMHLQLLARRVGAYFGIGRLSPRVVAQVEGALESRARYGGEDGIVWRLDQDPTMVPPVRVAGAGAEAKRAIDEVPLAELASAARIVVERAGGIAGPDLVRDTARLLGFARITEDVTARIRVGVQLATQRELIRIDDNRASIPN